MIYKQFYVQTGKIHYITGKLSSSACRFSVILTNLAFAVWNNIDAMLEIANNGIYNSLKKLFITTQHYWKLCEIKHLCWKLLCSKD
jgi:hypothetical protein